MADEKGGGWDWGPLEAVIAILLLIGLFDHFSGGKASQNSVANQSGPSINQQVYEQGSWCGLSVTRPEPNEKTANAVAIAGSVGLCDWLATDTTALYAQVIDKKGEPVSAYVAIPALPANGLRTPFLSTVWLTKIPARGTGYLILVPAVQTSSKNVSVRIPLTF